MPHHDDVRELQGQDDRERDVRVVHHRLPVLDRAGRAVDEEHVPSGALLGDAKAEPGHRHVPPRETFRNGGVRRVPESDHRGCHYGGGEQSDEGKGETGDGQAQGLPRSIDGVERVQPRCDQPGARVKARREQNTAASLATKFQRRALVCSVRENPRDRQPIAVEWTPRCPYPATLQTALPLSWSDPK